MSYLDEVIASTRRRIAKLHQVLSTDALEQRIASVEAPRGFSRALGGDGVAVIAEIKRASPSKGLMAPDLNASEAAAAYARGGAAAISVLTEPDHFEGTMEDLKQAKGAGLPVLRKDFILDELQMFESRAEGADAVLLIVRCLSDEELPVLHRAGRALGMDVLVEVFDEADLDRAFSVEPDLIGINHRDLATFEVDPFRTESLAPKVPEGVILVSLSGVRSRSEVEAMGAAGAAAVLVGESVATAPDPAAAVAELCGGIG